MMKTKHIHYDLILLWANGETIEYYNKDEGCWEEVSIGSPTWHPDIAYRVKEKQMEQFFNKAFVIDEIKRHGSPRRRSGDTLKLVWEGQELIAAIALNPNAIIGQ